jgi:hypothetical protein
MVTAFFYFITAVLLIASRPVALAEVPAPPAPAVSEAAAPDPLPPQPETPPAAADSQPAPRKTGLRFSLLLPLFLEEQLQEDTAGAEPAIDPRSMQALHFYEGALLAAEQLAEEGLTLGLPVTDIGHRTDAKKVLLLDYLSLRTSDLLVANFQPAECEPAAAEAGRLGLPLALMQYGHAALLEGRPGLALLSPPPFVQCRRMAAFLAWQAPARKYYIVARSENRENELAENFRAVLDTALPAPPVMIDDFDAVFPRWLSLVDTLQDNHLVLPSSDESYVSSVLNRLDTLGVPMTVTGLPTWEQFETLRLGRFRHLRVNIFSSTWLDERTVMTSFRKRFLARYKTDALFSAYQGYAFCLQAARMLSRGEKNFADGLPAAFAGAELFEFETVPGGGAMNVRMKVLEYDQFELRDVD